MCSRPPEGLHADGCARLSSLTHAQTAGEHSTAHLHLHKCTGIVEVSHEHYLGVTHLMLSACTPYPITTAKSISNINCGLAIQVANAHGHSAVVYM